MSEEKKKSLQINFEEIVNNADQPLVQKEAVQDEFLQLLQQEKSSSEEQNDEQNVSFAFPFYRTIKQLLYVYGDKKEPQEQTIQIIHLQLQELLQEIFKISKLEQILSSKQSGEIDLYIFSDNDTKKLSTDKLNKQQQRNCSVQQLLKELNCSTLKARRMISRYIHFIFEDYHRNYESVQLRVRKVFLQKTLLEQFEKCQQQKSLYKQAIEKKQQQSRKQQQDNLIDASESDSSFSDNFKEEQFSSESEEQVLPHSEATSQVYFSNSSGQQQDNQQLQNDHQIKKKVNYLEKWDLHMKNRIDNMSIKEFNKFMRIRNKTFYFQKGVNFEKFIDQNNYGSEFTQNIKKEMKFLNYCLCKILKRIVQNCFIKWDKETENFTVEEQDAKLQGDQIVRNYILKSEKYTFWRKKIQTMAYNIFKKEYKLEGYEAFICSMLKVKIVKKNFEQLQNVKDDEIYENWKKLKNSRKSWVDRVRAEQFIKRTLLLKRKVKPPNDYAQFLEENVKHMNYDEAKQHFTKIFKRWLVGVRTTK